MSRNDKPSSGYLGSAIGTLAAVLAVYLGAYFALLEGKVYWPIGVDAATGINLFEAAPRYRVQGKSVEKVFSPANWIDRMLRDEFWETIEKQNGRKWKNPPPKDP